MRKSVRAQDVILENAQLLTRLQNSFFDLYPGYRFLAQRLQPDSFLDAQCRTYHASARTRDENIIERGNAHLSGIKPML